MQEHRLAVAKVLLGRQTFRPIPGRYFNHISDSRERS
jgi:hypothetical protein